MSSSGFFGGMGKGVLTMRDRNGNTLDRGACYVCGRWGTRMVVAGPDMVRHEDCAPGSEQWAEKFPKSYLGAYYNKQQEA